MGLHFSYLCNVDISWAKHVLLVISYVFGQVNSDDISYLFVHSTFPLIVQVFKHKTGYLIFGMTGPQSIVAFPETSKVSNWFQSKIKFVWIHPTCVFLHKFQIKTPLVHNFQLIVVVPFWVLLWLHFSAPATGFLRRGPSQDVPFDIIIWYISKTIHEDITNNIS